MVFVRSDLAQQSHGVSRIAAPAAEDYDQICGAPGHSFDLFGVERSLVSTLFEIGQQVGGFRRFCHTAIPENHHRKVVDYSSLSLIYNLCALRKDMRIARILFFVWRAIDTISRAADTFN